MTVGELLQRISSKELTEWMAFYNIEPFGYEANLVGHSIVASAVANTTRTKASDKVWKPQDFMPTKQDDKPKEPSDMFRKLKEYLVNNI